MNNNNSNRRQLLRTLISSNKTINHLISNNPSNDLSLITDIENILIKKRGKVFPKIKQNQPVIALMSGGLDTTVVIGILLKIFKAQVYPLFIDRDLSHNYQVKKSVNFFSNYFKEKYPDQFHDVFKIKASIPPKEIRKEILAAENDIINSNGNRKGVPLQPSLYAHYAFMYSKYLEETKKIRIRTITGAWLPSNSQGYAYETITSLRSIMLNLCIIDNDFSWQFTSLPMEKNLGFYFDKNKLVEIGHAMGLPLEKTWTCFSGKKYQCGACPPCWSRIEAYSKAKIVDKITYKRDTTNLNKLVLKIKKLNYLFKEATKV